MQEFDLIVIGSGSGLDVANAAFQHGLKVAVVEKDRMGGTCLNRGCIPSKLLIHSADILETIKQAPLFGINVQKYSVDYQKIVERVNGIIDSHSDEIRNAFNGVENPKLFSKECRFIGLKTLLVCDKDYDAKNQQNVITADKIVIVAGSRPRIPKISGLEGSGYITSDEALRLKKQPHTLTIIGGGFVACELAHFFGALGTKINIVQNKELLMPDEDEEVSERFTQVFSKKYNVYVEYETEYVSKRHNDDHNDNQFHVLAKKNSTGDSVELVSDQLLIAAGRIPNSDTLDLQKTGVKVDDRNFIITDQYLETGVKGIFALGDVIGRYLFKHSANHEARYAFNNLLHPNKVPVDYTAMPHAIFSSPQVAGVGFTEQELTKRGIDYQKSVYPYMDTAMGQAIQDRDGFVKFLVAKENGEILGCHIIGSEASILIHEVLIAIKAGGHQRSDGRGTHTNGTIDNIVNTIHIHPALSEVIARAANNF